MSTFHYCLQFTCLKCTEQQYSLPPWEFGQWILQNGAQLSVEEPDKLPTVIALLRERQHETPDVGEKLRGADVVHMLLEVRDHFLHDALDLEVKLTGVYSWVLFKWDGRMIRRELFFSKTPT